MPRNLTGWIFAAPALLLITLFFVLPIFAALLLSFSDFDLYALADWRQLRFVGLQNYSDLLATPLFWQALLNTGYFVLLGVPLSIAASLTAALLLNSPLARFVSFFRTAMFAPVVTTLVAVALLWRYVFHTRYGLANWALGHIGINPVDWLGDPYWAMPTIVLLAVWKNFGYNMVIFLAGLQAIPKDLYEAAGIDGASTRQQFWHITIPMLGPVLMLVSIVTLAGYFQLFAEPYVMTRGDPLQSTVSVLYMMFEEGFRWWNLGRACAVAFLLFIIIIAATQLLSYFGRRRGWL